ncbi:MAG: biopolymer transporter ExbD [Deltaproteobacteria bacterium]|nr:biopolymer transporter ExbD [Deltaproteobacteria bacterium]MBI3016761.1 biopolymer transporter ExbD [Deltaproteobacteria bacterium]
MNFSSDTHEKDEVTIEITSLIDVMFTLVLFFLVTTTFVSAPGMKVDLPKSSAQDIQRDKKDITIVIGSNHQLLINQKAVNEKELQTKLSAQAKENPQTLVIIQADQGVSHGLVVRIMDYAREAGLSRLAIATEPK